MGGDDPCQGQGCPEGGVEMPPGEDDLLGRAPTDRELKEGPEPLLAPS
jgi:hypothetical protein